MSRDLNRWREDVMARLVRGEHLVLYGPRGAGKSTLLAGLHAEFLARGVPCALAPATAHLDDLTRALERAYPGVDTAGLARRRARSRLRLTADRHAGVLLLDHVTEVGTAMTGFLRRLRGGIVGVVLAVDVETARERDRLRYRVLGTDNLPMPPLAPYRLRRQLRARCVALGIPPLAPRAEGRIVRAARGRPGWIEQCATRLADRRYWRGGALHVTVLCTDSEIALRQGALQLLPPATDAAKAHLQPENQETS
jgi:predicted ATPase